MHVKEINVAARFGEIAYFLFVDPTAFRKAFNADEQRITGKRRRCRVWRVAGARWGRGKHLP